MVFSLVIREGFEASSNVLLPRRKGMRFELMSFEFEALKLARKRGRDNKPIQFNIKLSRLVRLGLIEHPYSNGETYITQKGYMKLKEVEGVNSETSKSE